MTKILFVFSLTALLFVLFQWCFRNLPGENWQFMAAVPSTRTPGGSWRAINLTYYGFFNATACVFACAIVILLMCSIGVPLGSTLLVTTLLLLICYPASRFVAYMVERKKHTFTVAGASFVGFITLPWLIQLFNILATSKTHELPAIQLLAAVSIAYAFGEALGRMACISFGCCYGKLIWHTPRVVQKLFAGTCFTFRGKTKKVAYESGLNGMPLVPIQAVTAIVSASAAVLGVCFFLASEWKTAVVVTIGITQIWRAISETLRADYRGRGKISAYQVMALITFFYSLGVLFYLEPSTTHLPDIMLGLRALSMSSSILVLQALWLTVFVYLGRSSAANLSFHIVRERI